MNTNRPRSWTLKIEILILFLVLISVKSFVLITFHYQKHSEIIGWVSKWRIRGVSELILEKTHCVLQDLERVPELGVGILLRHPEVSIDNIPMTSYFLDSIKYYPGLSGSYMGNPQGDSMLVFSLERSKGISKFPEAPPIPPNAKWVLIVVKQAQKQETWYFYDNALNLINSHPIAWRGYDPRKRPWYIGAVKSGKLYWTDVFFYDPAEALGIATAKPIYDAKGRLVSVIATNLALQSVASFLNQQEIGKEGRAFVLDQSGKIVVPVEKERREALAPVAAAAYQNSYKNPAQDFSFYIDKVEYLASVQNIPVGINRSWLIFVTDPLSDSEYFAKLSKEGRREILIALIALIIAGFIVAYFAKRISDPIVALIEQVDEITRLQLGKSERCTSRIREISLLDGAIDSLKKAVRSFGRYVPKEVVKELFRRGKDIQLGGEKKELTILFTDITDFTPVAEALPIDQVSALLAEYFDLCSKVILKHGGTIDKYMGDGMMAFWGAPEEIDDSAGRACQAALECQEGIDILNTKRKKEKLPEFKTRMGLETGRAFVGNVGTAERMNYTAIGDVVNAAARLEQLNKTYQTRILIGEETAEKIGKRFTTRFVDTAEIKGKKKKVKIYELVR